MSQNASDNFLDHIEFHSLSYLSLYIFENLINMIEFIEDTSSGYGHRTYENARLADLTIAFAVIPDSSGEKTTMQAAAIANKPMIMVDLSTNTVTKYRFDNLDLSNIRSINVAGNGMSRFAKQGYTQERVDDIVYMWLKRFIEDNNLNITEIRSGGQTGADESGLKAAVKLGIKAVCLCPKGWRFRTSTEDISDEVQFKKRFAHI